MADAIVWKGLARVRPREDADFDGAGAYMNVLVLARDHEECTKLVAAAMGDHACDLVDVELDPLELELSGDEQDAECRDVAEGLSADQPIWCQGTFYIYENDDHD